jgi:hypothetical protein
VQEARNVRDDWDDDQLLAALRESVRARLAVPPWFTQTARNAYAWHDIDAELAQLTYDSSHDEDLELIMRWVSRRSEPASIRALTFASAQLSIELEVTSDSLIGQIVPPRPGVIEHEASSGETTTEPIDEIGCFCIQPVPEGSFRLRCRTEDGVDVVTNWFTL